MIFSLGSTKTLWATDQDPVKGHAEEQAWLPVLVVQDLAYLSGFMNPTVLLKELKNGSWHKAEHKDHIEFRKLCLSSVIKRNIYRA